MGYSANLVRGGDIALPVEQTWEMITTSTTNNRWSWTEYFDHYDELHADRGDRLATFLEDYGFETLYEPGSDRVVLTGWQGDKLGSTWDLCWGIISDVALTDYEWIMIGEDREVWTETPRDDTK